jgi:acetyl esterase/lipase
MTDEERRATVVKMTAVLALPGMDAVDVRRDLPYGDGDGRTFDLYRAATPGAPLVLFVFGFPDPRFAQGMRTMGSYRSWGQLLAASGMNAVAYSYRDPVADLRTLLAHLRTNAAALGLDAGRIGLWAASGNVPTALHLLMTEAPDAFRAAALLYGYMLDVPEEAEKFGLAVPARGKTIDDLPRSTPLLVVRAGADATPKLIGSLDAFASAALAANLPITLTNFPTGVHSFDLFDPSEASREHCRGVLTFLRQHLVG